MCETFSPVGSPPALPLHEVDDEERLARLHRHHGPATVAEDPDAVRPRCSPRSIVPAATPFGKSISVSVDPGVFAP